MHLNLNDRVPRDAEESLDTYYMYEKERHTSEIAAFHLDRLVLDFRSSSLDAFHDQMIPENMKHTMYEIIKCITRFKVYN